MDEPNADQRQYLNPVQGFLIRPKSTGNVRFEESPGTVKVHYCIYEEYTFDRANSKDQLMSILHSLNENNFSPTIEGSIEVKGEEGQSIKERTQVEGNYAAIKMKITDLPLKHLKGVLMKSSNGEFG